MEVEAYNKQGCAPPAPPLVVTPPEPQPWTPTPVANPTTPLGPTAGTSGPTTAFFAQPRHNGKRIDMCLTASADASCLDEGKSSANMFCRLQGYARMAAMGPLEWVSGDERLPFDPLPVFKKSGGVQRW